MKLKLLITYFLVIPSYLHAGALGDFIGGLYRSTVEILSESSGEGLSVGSLLNQCQKRELNSESSEQNALCAEKLCANKKIPSVYLSNKSLEKRLGDDSKKALKKFAKVEPGLVESIRGLEVNQRNLLQYTNDLFSKDRNEVSLVLNNMSEEKFQELANNILGEYVYNYRWAENDPEQDEHFYYTPKDFSLEEKKALESYSKEMKDKKDSYPTPVTPNLSIEDQRKTAKKSLRKMLEASKKTINGKKNHISELEYIDIEEDIEKKIEEIEGMEGEELEKLILDVDSKLRTYYSADDYFRELDVVKHENLSFCREECKTLVGSLVKKKLRSKLEKLERKSDDIVRDNLRHCQSLFATSYLENQGSEKLFNEALDSFVAKVIFSSDSKEDFKKIVKKMEIQSFKASNDDTGDMIDYFEAQKAPKEWLVDKFFSKEDKKTQETMPDKEKVLLTVLGYNNTRSTSRFDAGSLCPSILHNIQNVRFKKFIGPSEEFGKFKMSQGMSHHFIQGKQIIARELAHVLSRLRKANQLSSESEDVFDVERGCVRQNYGATYGDPNIRPDIYFEGDHYTTEEDFADLMAFKMYYKKKDKKRNKKKDEEEEIYSCGLFQDIKNSFNPDDYELIKKEPGKYESTPFFRLLQEVIHRELYIPDECQTVLNNNKERVNQNSCFSNISS